MLGKGPEPFKNLEQAWNSHGTCLEQLAWSRLGTGLEPFENLEQAWNMLGTGLEQLGTGLEQAWNRVGTGLERARSHSRTWNRRTGKGMKDRLPSIVLPCMVFAHMHFFACDDTVPDSPQAAACSH